MSREFSPHTHEEEERGINEVEDIEQARSMALAEKPIRDLARDTEAAPEIKKLKKTLNKEAARIGESGYIGEANPSQISDLELAHAAAMAEKPLRDLSRDAKADKRIKGNKAKLDKEAERIGTKEIYWLSQPITVIELSTKFNTTSFKNAAVNAGINTINDLVKQSPAQLLRKKRMGEKFVDEVIVWLEDHGLKLAK